MSKFAKRIGMKLASYDKFWLSIWPGIINAALVGSSTAWNLLTPYYNETVHNISLLANAIGTAFVIKIFLQYFQYKREAKARAAKMHADAQIVLDRVRPQLDEIFESVFKDGFTHEAMQEAAEKADRIIQQGFDDLDKSRSSESKPDKP